LLNCFAEYLVILSLGFNPKIILRIKKRQYVMGSIGNTVISYHVRSWMSHYKTPKAMHSIWKTCKNLCSTSLQELCISMQGNLHCQLKYWAEGISLLSPLRDVSTDLHIWVFRSEIILNKLLSLESKQSGQCIFHQRYWENKQSG
jgi:hypothetical protein